MSTFHEYSDCCTKAALDAVCPACCCGALDQDANRLRSMSAEYAFQEVGALRSGLLGAARLGGAE